MKYGDKRDYPKIDIYFNGSYKCSTTWSKTLKQAKENYIKSQGSIDKTLVKARFAK